MTYSVHQHWDPLKVCAVGCSYPPEFYSFIKNSKARSVMERIAEETEEDYQSLINLLHKFNVETVRPNVLPESDYYLFNNRYVSPPMCPRDYMAMIGETFYTPNPSRTTNWDIVKGDNWPPRPKTQEDWDRLPKSIKIELEGKQISYQDIFLKDLSPYKEIVDKVKEQQNEIVYTNSEINTAMITRIGKDLYHGTDDYEENQNKLLSKREKIFPQYRNHVVNSGGHADGTFCPVKPGLIISLYDIPTYKDTFPDWEVVYLPGQSWYSVLPFLDLKEKNQGKYWVPGEEQNDEFTDFVNNWLDNWLGYVEETVFDVNMLVIDEKNVICNNENAKVFEAFARHGITPHVCNFRHRYFWDGGIHCITQDLHREGIQKDYFPNRLTS